MEKLRCVCLLLALVLCLGFAGCDGYDDYPALIVGTWENASVPGRTERFAFSADGTGEYTLISGEKELLSYSFTYSLSENTLSLIPEGVDKDDAAFHTVLIEDNTMTLTQGKSSQEFTKKQ